MGPIWGRQDPGGPHVGPVNFVFLVVYSLDIYFCFYVSTVFNDINEEFLIQSEYEEITKVLDKWLHYSIALVINGLE